MEHDLLFYELLLGAVLWLGGGVYWWWQRGPAAKPPPSTQIKRSSQAPKPFTGLTHKPPCPACEQGPAHRAQPPLSPPPRITSKRGRPRTVDGPGQYCPQQTCPYYGWIGRGNLRANGHPSNGAWRQFPCVVCGTYFLEPYGTPLSGKPRPAERIVQAVAALAEGLGSRAVARVFEVDPPTVLRWSSEAADHLTAFSHSFRHDVQVQPVQLDELCAWVSEVKPEQGRETATAEHCPRSPYWGWVAMDPVSKLLLALEGGERTLEIAHRLVHHVRQGLAPGWLPLFVTDGLKAYATALLTHYGHWLQPPRCQATGPGPKARWLPRPELVYAQVVKRSRRRRLLGMHSWVVFGTRAEVRPLLAPRGWGINTAFIERLNLTLRHHVAAVGRRVRTVAKSPGGLRAQLHLSHAYYNFCLPHVSLRVPLAHPRPTRGKGSAKRWHSCTPAMAAGLTERVWSLRDVLLFRVPPWPQPRGLGAREHCAGLVAEPL